MTAAMDIITAGFREMNVIPVGKEPTSAEQAEGLQVLNRALAAVYGYVVGENLVDWPVPAKQRTGAVAANPPLLPHSQTSFVELDNAYPPANARVVWDGSKRTVYFHETPGDGARMALVQSSGASAAGSGTLTIDGNGRLIEGQDTYTAGESGRRWMYRADKADWVALTTLSTSDDMPFPPEFDDFWIGALAIRLSPRYGKQLQPGTTEMYRRLKAQLEARYAQDSPGTSGGALLQPSHQSHENGWFDLP